MASIIRIKRSGVSGNPGTLGAGELAYSALADNGSNGGDRLYIGFGTETNGNAVNHIVIGGKYFTDRLDHTAGTLTANSALVVDSNSKIDVLNVDNLTLNGNTLSSTNSNGDINIDPDGTGAVNLYNPYIYQTSTSSLVSLDEYIQDAASVAVDGGTGITDSYNDTTGVVTLNLDNTAVTPGSYGSTTQIPTFTVDQQGRLTAAGSVSVATTLNLAGESGTGSVDLLSQTLTITGGEGIDVVAGNQTITVSGEDASNVNKGVASFDSTDFTVTNGNVAVNTITLGSSSLNPGQTTTDIAGLTSVTVDNINVDGNTVSTSTGDLTLNPTGNVDVNSNRIINLAEPVNDQDAATKYYVDAARSGLDIKNSVRAATTAAITLASDLENGDTLDGVTLATGDRVLVKNQVDASENGIYVVAASGAPSRSTDADQPAELNAGTFVFVEEGTVNDNTGFVVVSDNPLTIGTDDIEWTLFSSSGTLIAGDGLSKNGYTLQVNTANGLQIASDNVELAPTVAGAGLTFTSGVVDVVGTANRITVNANDIDIASTYVGQTSITTLGTVTTGTWNADIVQDAYVANDLTISGGTVDNTPIGATTASSGAFTTLTASGATTLTANTASTSTTTGTLVVTGGIGMSGTMYVGTNLVGAGAGTSDIDGFNIDGGTY